MATTSILPTESQPPPLADSPFIAPPPPTAPGTYPPSPHGQTHISTDLVPIVTTSAPGLAPQLSANPNTWLNGNGTYTTPPGTPLNLRGTVSTYSALPSTANALNDFWVTLDTGHGWAWNGTIWVDMGPFQGPAGPAGPAGGAGPQGPGGPAGQGYTWLGAWNSGMAYVSYQTVSYQGSSYVCIAANTNQLPTNTTYWNIIAQTGQPGSAGVAGPQGPPGTTGASGPAGPSGYSLTTAQVTIPAAGATTTVTLASVTWANVGDYVSVQGAAGSGQSAVLQITAINIGTSTITLLNPLQGGGIPLASNAAPGLLNQISGNSTDYIGGDNAGHNLVAAIDPEIWSVRLRSFNAIGNSTFECDARNVGAALTNPANATFIQDRWQVAKVLGGTGAVNTALQTGLVTIPGTNFAISTSFQRFTVGTAQATLAAGDRYSLQQFVEGPQWRELSSDVHSISVLVRSSVAGLAFATGLANPARTSSLKGLCTIPTANVWTLLTLPNLPIWSGSGFVATPGQQAYFFDLCLASGTTFIPPANLTWQAGDFRGAVGMSNFLATAGATLDIAFIGHEPGAICSTPIDYPFTRNYYDCLRYFQKSGSYVTPAKTDSPTAFHGWGITGSTTIRPSVKFHRPMAKVPTFTPWYNSTGNTVFIDGIGAIGIASASATETEVTAITASANLTASGSALFGWTADTNW